MNKNKWIESTLGDYVSHKKGFAFKSKSFIRSGIPIVKVTDFTDSSVDGASLDYVDENLAKEKSQYRLKIGDTVIQTVGSWPNNPASVVGKAIKLPRELDGALLNQNAVILRPKSGLNKEFLFYIVKSNMFKGFIINTAQGAANQASITLDSIFRFPFYRPQIQTQKKIAAILSAYDDLIENNKRRIALLENMAEEIYREWFVRFRFPGYQTAEFEKGVPKGWKSRASDEVLDILSGGTPKTNVPSFWGGDIPFFTPKDTTDNFYVLTTEKYITGNGLEKCNSKLYEKNIIFITARGTVGKIALAHTEMAMNQSCYALRPKDRMFSFFYFLSMKNAISQIKGVSKSGVFDNIVVDTFKIVPLIIPSEEIMMKFDDLISPAFEQIGNLLLSIENIEKTKNMLLPRLISGKLSVENLDIQFPPSMQITAEAE